MTAIVTTMRRVLALAPALVCCCLQLMEWVKWETGCWPVVMVGPDNKVSSWVISLLVVLMRGSSDSQNDAMALAHESQSDEDLSSTGYSWRGVRLRRSVVRSFSWGGWTEYVATSRRRTFSETEMT
jgi:hypothetical protein